MAFSKINTNDAECKALSIYTVIEPRVLNETFSKTHIATTKSYDLEDQQKEVELKSENFDSVLNLKEPLYRNNKNNNIFNDMSITKDIIISTVNSILIDLNNNAKVDLITLPRLEAQITHRESVGINTTTLINEVTNKNLTKKFIRFTKLQDLDDQQKEVVLESENFEPISNTTKPLYTNTKEKNILIDVKLTKDLVMRAIDSLLIDLKNDVKVELTTLPQPTTKRTHREGVRMNTTALRREMYIKNKLQKKY